MIEYAKMEAEVTIKAAKNKFEPSAKVAWGDAQMSKASEFGKAQQPIQPAPSSPPPGQTPGAQPGSEKDFQQQGAQQQAPQNAQPNAGYAMTVTEAQEQGMEIKPTDTISIGGIDLGKL